MSTEIQTAAILEELSAFASRASHEMTGTLNQAATLLSLFLKRHPQPDEDDKALVGHLENAARRMQGHICGLQTYLGFAAVPPHFQLVNAAAALGACEKSLQPAIAETGARIISGALPEVLADPLQFHTLLCELIGNALKFRKPLEPPVVKVKAEREGDFRVFTITDNGLGMEQNLADEALLPFRRLKGREFSGSGLGLATAQLIVRLHGGRMSLESGVGAGTSVTFTMRAFTPELAA